MKSSHEFQNTVIVNLKNGGRQKSFLVSDGSADNGSEARIRRDRREEQEDDGEHERESKLK